MGHIIRPDSFGRRNLSIAIHEDTYQKIRHLAFERDVTRSSVGRQLMELALKLYEQKHGPIRIDEEVTT